MTLVDDNLDDNLDDHTARTLAKYGTRPASATFWLRPTDALCNCGHLAFEHGGEPPSPCILTGNGECDCRGFVTARTRHD